jgi:sortase (surface protein transpeptidase)
MAADDGDTWNKLIKSTSKEGITLVTCGGDFNRATGEYDKRHIVTGERV